VHDRLLIILSGESMKSEWVKREIRNARRAEKIENRRKLFPITLVDYQAIENWKGFDGDGGEDLAFELSRFYIRDFCNWKDQDSFEQEFAKLMRDLRAEER
jgi:CO dehydrogenase/acetyl-CoA synthase epsilon subunit